MTAGNFTTNKIDQSNVNPLLKARQYDVGLLANASVSLITAAYNGADTKGIASYAFC